MPALLLLLLLRDQRQRDARQERQLQALAAQAARAAGLAGEVSLRLSALAAGLLRWPGLALMPEVLHGGSSWAADVLGHDRGLCEHGACHGVAGGERGTAGEVAGEPEAWLQARSAGLRTY